MAMASAPVESLELPTKLRAEDVNVYYGSFQAIKNV